MLAFSVTSVKLFGELQTRTTFAGCRRDDERSPNVSIGKSTNILEDVGWGFYVWETTGIYNFMCAFECSGNECGIVHCL